MNLTAERYFDYLGGKALDGEDDCPIALFCDGLGTLQLVWHPGSPEEIVKEVCEVWTGTHHYTGKVALEVCRGYGDDERYWISELQWQLFLSQQGRAAGHETCADELEQALAAEAEERAEQAKKAAALDRLERAAKYIHTSDSASGLGTTTFTVSKRGAISEPLYSLQALAEALKEEE